MATIYLRSTDGSDADNGSTWALAKATLAAALTAAGAGGRVYVSHSHAETQASTITLTSPGTAASPTEIICVNDGAEPPTALATTATVTSTGNSRMDFAGFAYSYGVSYSAQTGGNTLANVRFISTAPWWWRIEAGQLKDNSTANNTAPGIYIGSTSGQDDQLLELINTTVFFGHASHAMRVYAPFVWRNTASAIAGTVPTVLFTTAAGASGGTVDIQGVDLSAAGSGQSLIDVSDARFGHYRLVDCKLGASVAITTGTHPGQGGVVVDLVNCDSADTNYRFYRQNYQATEQQETTIVRTGGASDGTTTISRKIVTTANTKIYSPYATQWISFWNERLESMTVTIPVITDNVTLTDAEAWLEVDYLGTSGVPLALSASDRVADQIFGTPVAQTTDSISTWTTTGLTTPVKQSLAVTFTPAEKGVVRVRVVVAKASTTVYYDPKAQVG